MTTNKLGGLFLAMALGAYGCAGDVGYEHGAPGDGSGGEGVGPSSVDLEALAFEPLSDAELSALDHAEPPQEQATTEAPPVSSDAGEQGLVTAELNSGLSYYGRYLYRAPNSGGTNYMDTWCARSTWEYSIYGLINRWCVATYKTSYGARYENLGLANANVRVISAYNQNAWVRTE